MPWKKNEIISLLLEAGELAMANRRTIGWELKADRSLVTETDRAIEALLTKALERPESGTFIIGEETVDEKGEDYVQRALREEAFVIDPIDGTVPYAHKLPNWGISIGHMVEGRLVDGAVYLPMFNEIVLSEGDAVLEGVSVDGKWTWAELGEPTPDTDGTRLVAVTQGLAKRGTVDVPNTVMSLGSAVVPLLGLVQGRFVGYLGNVRLWDAAGALPLLLKKNFHVAIHPDGERREVTAEVSDRIYHLDAGSPRRWKFRSDLLLCHPDDEERFRQALVYR